VFDTDPTLSCLNASCQTLSERTANLSAWTVSVLQGEILITLQLGDDPVHLLVRGPDHPKSYGVTPSFTLALQSDGAVGLLSQEVEALLTRLVEIVRKNDPGDLCLPTPEPQRPEDSWDADNVASDEPGVPMDVISQPAPGGPLDIASHRSEWMTAEADNAHAAHQNQLDWLTHCAHRIMTADSDYPHRELLGATPPDPNEAAHTYLIDHLKSGFKRSTFRAQFGKAPEDIAGAAMNMLADFEVMTLSGDQINTEVHSPAYGRVYELMFYPPPLIARMRAVFESDFDPKIDPESRLADLIAHYDGAL
jgi:hypothetical protein